MTYLLDTAPWINGVTLPEVLPPRIRRLLEVGEPKGLCSVSLLEAAILHRLGRLELNTALAAFFAVGLASDLEVIELTPSIAARTNDLPTQFQGDPFDRAIVATAAVLNLTLVTADPAIRDAGACAVEVLPVQAVPPQTRQTARIRTPRLLSIIHVVQALGSPEHIRRREIANVAAGEDNLVEEQLLRPFD